MWSNGQDLNDDGDRVQILDPIIKNHNKSNIENSIYNNCDPKGSYIGGRPYYLHPNVKDVCGLIPLSEIDDEIPRCKRCGDLMFLLLQLYAPIEKQPSEDSKISQKCSTLQRALHLFACNRAECLRSLFHKDGAAASEDETKVSKFHLGGGGVVKCLRTQYVECSPLSAGNEKGNDIEHDTDSDTGDGKPKWSQSADNTDEEDDWGISDYGSWGEEDNEIGQTGTNPDSSSMDDLEAMLSALEAKDHKKNSKNVVVNETKNKVVKQKIPHSTNSKSSKSSNKLKSFPCFEISLYDEPTIGTKSNARMELADSDDDEDVGTFTKNSDYDDDAIHKMLDRYLKEEQDADILSMIGTKKSRNNTNSNTKSKSSGADGEKYERVSPDQKAFLAFTDRIKRVPTQIGRYAYGGVPMWSMPTPQENSRGKMDKRRTDNKFPQIPNCPCGSNRSFEFQLLPSILHTLNVDNYTLPNRKTNDLEQDKHCIETFMNGNDGGMNWGCICVFSCELSCNLHNEEFVIIQDSLDDIPKRRQFQPLVPSTSMAEKNNEE